jgi:hypothetical protein
MPDPGDKDKVSFSQEEEEYVRLAFLRFDKDRNGTIDANELKTALESFCGQKGKVSDEEVFVMIAEVDVNANGVVDFSEFQRVLLNQKQRATEMNNEEDLSECPFLSLLGLSAQPADFCAPFLHLPSPPLLPSHQPLFALCLFSLFYFEISRGRIHSLWRGCRPGRLCGAGYSCQDYQGGLWANNRH